MSVVGVGIVLVAFLALKVTQSHIIVAVLQLLGVGIVIRAGHDDHLVVSFVGLAVSAAAVDGLQVSVGVVVAVTLGVDIHVIIQGVHSLLFFLAQLVACGNSSIVQSVSVLGAVDGAGQEVVGPGGAGGLIIGLAAQGSGGAQAKPLQIVAVLADVFVDGVNVEIVQLHGGNLVLANHQSGGHTAGQAHNGSFQSHTGYQRHAQGQNHPEGDGVNLQFLGFFCCGLLLLGHGGSVLLLAELLLAGCTHGKSIPLKICAVGCCANGLTHRPEHYNRFDTEFQVLFLPNQQKS